MEDASNLDFRQWANLDPAYLRQLFMCQQSNLKFDEVQQINPPFSGRDTVILEHNNPNVVHTFPLLQREITYADRHAAALVERDNVLATLSMIQDDINLDKLPETLSILSPHLPVDGMDNNHHVENNPTQRQKQTGKKSGNESSKKRKEDGVTSQPNKASKTPRKRQKARDQHGAANVEKIKRDDNVNGVVTHEFQIDVSTTASPFCSCTGTNRQCYRWGKGGWQSSCCTNSFSEYPLPMNTEKRGSRIAGRKMSGGAFKKLLEKLAGQGVDITQPIDLKDHWAKHGTC
ncbi:hypothetical protein KP509_33G015200 [Ceratopteris richardii]|uniref:GAGA-binding transcriptional activator n=1 Tax=Ceratopteris richardii TaxID=49495 RepID=A0A8T2QMI5_CERRI|nr:hypothetical protein KP509_33G015200 [Ceratopteris richardii]